MHGTIMCQHVFWSVPRSYYHGPDGTNWCESSWKRCFRIWLVYVSFWPGTFLVWVPNVQGHKWPPSGTGSHGLKHCHQIELSVWWLSSQGHPSFCLCQGSSKEAQRGRCWPMKRFIPRGSSCCCHCADHLALKRSMRMGEGARLEKMAEGNGDKKLFGR